MPSELLAPSPELLRPARGTPLFPNSDPLPMTLDDYQLLALRTLGSRPPEQQLANAALGLAGEAGEVADAIKKHLFHGRPLDRDAVVRELGDCLWYVATMAAAIGASLDEVGATNVDKLRRRYPDGFSSEASLRRADQGA